MKLEKEFNAYLADLAVMNFKLHNIHWNVEGMQFVAVHEFTEKLYDEMFDNMDEVAEHMKKYQIFPDATLESMLKNASIKEEPSRRFECAEGLKIVLADLELLRKNATDLRNKADEENWFSAVGMLEDEIDSYNKHIWFIRATLG